MRSFLFVQNFGISPVVKYKIYSEGQNCLCDLKKITTRCKKMANKYETIRLVRLPKALHYINIDLIPFRQWNRVQTLLFFSKREKKRMEYSQNILNSKSHFFPESLLRQYQQKLMHRRDFKTSIWIDGNLQIFGKCIRF